MSEKPPVVLTPSPGAGLPADIASYNAHLATAATTGTDKWFTASWLFAECYMYRRLRALFAAQPHWAAFDCFQAQKMAAFGSSAKGIMDLATSMEALVSRGKPAEDVLHAEWDGIMSTCLWGNVSSCAESERG